MFITDVLYNLKRDYGEPINIYTTSESVDVDSGEITTESIVQHINKCVEVSKQSNRELVKLLNLKYGGNFDIDIKIFLIDAKDVLPTFTPTYDMHLIYRTRRFQFTEIEELPNRAGWAISAKEVKNVRLSQVLNINVGDNLNLNEQ